MHGIREEVPTRQPIGGEWGEMHVGDAAVAELARRQHGVVTTRQLAACGLGRSAVSWRVANGRLTPMFRGVYQVGPIAAPWGREMAAVLACGPGTLLSHQSAAGVWGFRSRHEGAVHVTVGARDQRPRPGIRTHRTTRTASVNAAVRNGLPLTTVARTLEDLARHVPQHELERAVEEAQVLRLVTRAELDGSPALRLVLAHEPRFTRSEAEQRLLRLIRAARLPEPVANVRVAGFEVDLLWPRHRLIVEVDGFAYHGNRAAFERDRRRDAALTAARYRVVRITWRRLVHEPHAVVALLARLLPP